MRDNESHDLSMKADKLAPREVRRRIQRKAGSGCGHIEECGAVCNESCQKLLGGSHNATL